MGRQIAQAHGIQRVDTDLDRALAWRPDAAVITTPAHLHVPLAVKLVEAGVHVLIEKPLGTGLEGTQRLAQAVAARRVVAAVAYVQRANPLLQAMRAAILAGQFGPPVQVVVTSGQHFPTYRPAYRSIYYRDRATGGGAIQDALTHLINAVEWIVGPAQRVLADAGHQVLEGVDVEDTVHLLTRHGPVMASFALNQHQAPNETAVTVVCRQATARWQPQRNRWRWMTGPDEPWHDQCIEPLERDVLFVRQAESFLDAVDGRGPPLCSLAEGLQTLRVNLAALASWQSAAWQTIERECS